MSARLSRLQCYSTLSQFFFLLVLSVNESKIKYPVVYVDLSLFLSTITSCMMKLFYCVYIYLKLICPLEGLAYLSFILLLIYISPPTYRAIPAFFHLYCLHDIYFPVLYFSANYLQIIAVVCREFTLGSCLYLVWYFLLLSWHVWKICNYWYGWI